jgi:PadR family transcriptional regulator PadR
MTPSEKMAHEDVLYAIVLIAIGIYGITRGSVAIGIILANIGALWLGVRLFHIVDIRRERTRRAVLEAIQSAAPDAYGVTISDQLVKLTGREFSYGRIYVCLEGLERDNLVRSWQFPGGLERAGKPKRLYYLTATGRRLLGDAE